MKGLVQVSALAFKQICFARASVAVPMTALGSSQDVHASLRESHVFPTPAFVYK